MTDRPALVGWQPVSSCGPHCLPAAEPTSPVLLGRAAARFVALLGVLVAGVGLAGVLPLLPAGRRGAAGRAWARSVAGALGAELVVRGRLPRGGVLLVANHSSWLDVPALLALGSTRLVAKREVGRWPLIGLLAAAGGTVFVDRRRLRSLPATVDRVATVLRAGQPVAVFPEGTTWCGGPRPLRREPQSGVPAQRSREPDARPSARAGTGAVDGPVGDCRPAGGFRPALFQAAIDVGAPVVPVRIAYRWAATGAATTAAGFLGDESLWGSIRRVLTGERLVISVTVAAALRPAPGADRRRLAEVAESALRLGVARRPDRPLAEVGSRSRGGDGTR